MNTVTQDIVSRLWSLCHVLRDDGVTYHQYVTELTYLLFLKMAAETGTEAQIPAGWRWANLRDLTGLPESVTALEGQTGAAQLQYYKQLLLHLESNGSRRVQSIFTGAYTFVRKPRTLARLVSEIEKLDWFSMEREQLGDLYEGLLEKNAGEKKSGAGQYFTPRPLIDAIVDLIKPRPGERVQDPACGTGGFLIAADAHVKKQTDDLSTLDEQLQLFQEKEAYVGVELVPETHRLALMNMMLHDIHSEVTLGDTMAKEGAALKPVDVMLSNPPFGTKKGGGSPTRDDFTYTSSNKQLNFLMHIYRGLTPGGRAAVVLPDNVLFEDNTGQQIRTDLMNKCNLHTILRLPTGIFYAQGIKTNVLFFQRGTTDKDNTTAVWVYDLRTNMPKFGKRTPFTRAHLQPFVDAYGTDPNGGSPRTDEGEEGRFRCFDREAIAMRGDHLNLTWLRDDSVERAEDLPEPDVVAGEILEHLQTAMVEMQVLKSLLETSGEVNP